MNVYNGTYLETPEIRIAIYACDYGRVIYQNFFKIYKYILWIIGKYILWMENKF